MLGVAPPTSFPPWLPGLVVVVGLKTCSTLRFLNHNIMFLAYKIGNIRESQAYPQMDGSFAHGSDSPLYTWSFGAVVMEVYRGQA